MSIQFCSNVRQGLRCPRVKAHSRRQQQTRYWSPDASVSDRWADIYPLTGDSCPSMHASNSSFADLLTLIDMDLILVNNRHELDIFICIDSILYYKCSFDLNN